jgi:hypothetical protein
MQAPDFQPQRAGLPQPQEPISLAPGKSCSFDRELDPGTGPISRLIDCGHLLFVATNPRGYPCGSVRSEIIDAPAAVGEGRTWWVAQETVKCHHIAPDAGSQANVGQESEFVPSPNLSNDKLLWFG